MVTARRLRPYFLSHKVIVRTNYLLKQVIGRADLSGRMVKWAVELGEYDVDFEPRRTIKAQALSDFIQEGTRALEEGEWKVYVDGSVSMQGCGAGIVIIDPEGQETQVAVWFEFITSNNGA